MIIDELARYATEQTKAGLTSSVNHAAKRALVDWFAALLPGTRVQPALTLMKSHADELGLGYSSLPGLRTTSFPGTAAWINGSVSHAVEFDDIYRDAVYHPGCPTIAAALAVAEHTQASGKRLLEAITIGYEVSTRIGAAVQPSHYEFFHTTGTVGCFGAAAASAILASEAAGTTAHAMATAATFASGLQQAFRSDAMTKALHAGHAAWVGVVAARGAANGMTGVPDILEGAAGFGAAMAKNPDWSIATDGLGVDFNIEKVTVKNHGCCGHTFAAIDALLRLCSEHNISISDIEGLTVRTYQAAIEVAGIRNPKSAFECKFSIPYVISHAAKFGSVRLSAFDEERMWDPEVRELMSRITLLTDEGLTRQFPGRRAAKVEIRLRSGELLERYQPYRTGDPEEPLSDAQINDKFMELAEPVIGEGGARSLMSRLWSIDELTDVRQLHLAQL
ncbi:MmgE/PrpD family protein [Trinickia mobilis]|uniref:MmgE/PrpD family protein n=1 Tax=Trinickia mobilis TaxID=2816356 RepID=UPI001A8EDF0D|nr:MmgE/PrpD family protein [Trinickia mobilis]